MCYNCCCNTQQKRCYQIGVIFVSIYIIVFEIVLAVFSENKIKPEEVKDFILSERPVFDLEISNANSIAGKTNITFFEFKGRRIQSGDRTETTDKKNFTKIYGHKFFYDGKDRNYLDYKNKYSVAYGETCPTSTKPCGILDSSQRILCLPNDEDCPINDFSISKPPCAINSQEVTDTNNPNDPSIKYCINFGNNNPDGKIIIQFKLSYGEPCAKSSEINWIEVYGNEVEDSFQCSTTINGQLHSNIYDKVSNANADAGINIVSLYRDNGLTLTSPSPSVSSTYVDLYARNYKDIDEKCLEKFLEDFEDEKKYFVSAFKTARALSLIGFIFVLALFIYIFTTSVFCCNVTYHGIAIIVPIYGLVANIIIIGITNKAKINYKCQKEGLSSDVDEIIDDQYGSNTVNIVMSVLNIVGYSIVLMFTLCLKFMRNKGIVGGVSMPTPVVPVYPGAYPTPGYVAPYAPNIAYQNVIPASY